MLNQPATPRMDVAQRIAGKTHLFSELA